MDSLFFSHEAKVGSNQDESWIRSMEKMDPIKTKGGFDPWKSWIESGKEHCKTAPLSHFGFDSNFKR